MVPRTLTWAVMPLVLLLTACGGGGGASDSPPPPPPPATAPTLLSYASPQIYTVDAAIPVLSPTVSGTATTYTVSPALPAGLQLAANGEISGTPSAAAPQTTYVVTAGNSAGSTTFSLVITVNATYTVGGTVSGLTGAGLTLSNNGGAALVVNGDGSFTFAAPLTSGTAYAVTVITQPAGQSCSVAGGSGVVDNANVTSVAVTCAPIVAPTYSVGGTVSGLTATGLVLQNNGGGDLTVSADGVFTFTGRLNVGAAYLVTVAAQPAGQTCSVAQGSGTIGSTNVTNVAVICIPIVVPTYSVGGTVTGLAGTSVVLRNNGGDDLTVSANGSFTFATRLPSGSNYLVTVGAQPTGRTCVIGAGSGTIASANVSNVTVMCAGSTATMGGTVIGLAGTGLRVSNGSSEIAITGNGAFNFQGLFGEGINYHVRVTQAPAGPDQTCAIVNGIGTTTTTAVTNIGIICVNTPSPGRFVYTSNVSDNTISAWSINASTGSLTPVAGAPFAAGGTLSQLIAHPSGRFLYGRALGDDDVIRAFAVDRSSTAAAGALTTVVGSPFPVSSNAGRVFMDRSGKWLLVPSSSVSGAALSVFVIDAMTGALSHAPGSPYPLSFPAGDIVFRTDNKFVYIADPTGQKIFGYSIDATTGALTALISPFSTSGQSINRMIIDALGRFLYGTTAENGIYMATIDSASGALTPSTPSTISAGGNAPQSLVIDSLGRFAYVTLSNFPDPGFVSQFAMNPTTGVLSPSASVPVVQIGNGYLQNGLAMRLDSRFVYATTLFTDEIHALEIDSTSGQLYAVPGHPLAVGSGPNPPSVDPAGKFVYVTSAVNSTLAVYKSDLATGTLTLSPGSPYPTGLNPLLQVVVP